MPGLVEDLGFRVPSYKAHDEATDRKVSSSEAGMGARWRTALTTAMPCYSEFFWRLLAISRLSLSPTQDKASLPSEPLIKGHLGGRVGDHLRLSSRTSCRLAKDRLQFQAKPGSPRFLGLQASSLNFPHLLVA